LKRWIHQLGEPLANRDDGVISLPGFHVAGIPLTQDIKTHPAARVARLRTDGDTKISSPVGPFKDLCLADDLQHQLTLFID